MGRHKRGFIQSERYRLRLGRKRKFEPNFTKKDVGKFQVVYGEGIENYMNDAPVDIGIKNNFSNPIKPIVGVSLPVLGVVAFLDHKWSERFSTSAGYSLVNITNSNAQLPSAFH